MIEYIQLVDWNEGHGISLIFDLFTVVLMTYLEPR